MNKFKAIVREPALLIDFGETLIVFLVAFGLGGLTGDDQSYLVAALIALVGLAKAFTTKPFAVTALTDATRAVLVVAAAVFGVGLTSDQIVIAATLVGTLFSLIARAQITPRRDPIVAYEGSGSGPVSGESGYAILGTLGVVLVLVGVLLLVVTLLKVFVVSIPLIVVSIILGIVLIFLDGGVSRRVR